MPPQDQNPPKPTKAVLKTATAVNLACILEKADEQLLPAVYSYVAKSFGATPTALGALTLCGALVQALASPIGGLAACKYHRGTLISIGCVAWAGSCAVFATTQSIHVARLSWACNGFGLSLVIPNAQSLVADLFVATSRGSAFGMLFLTAQFGAMLGGLFATNVGKS